MKRLLLLVRETEVAWLRLDGDRIVARGTGALPEAAEPVDEVIAAVPGECTVVHWVELPELSPAQAQAAARLMVGDVVAAPAAETHAAIGPRDAEGYACLAVADSAAVAAWLDRCRAAGADPDRMIPAPLLLPEPTAGFRVAEAGDVVLVRGERTAFAAEPELAATLVGNAEVERVDPDAFEAGLAAALASAPVDLRQGPFARKQPWRIDWQRVRRAAMLIAAALLAMLLTQVALLFRYDLAADVVKLQLADEARAVLPRGVEVTDPVTQVGARLAELRGPGFSPAAAALVGALRDVEGAELVSLRYDPNGLSAAVATARGGDIDEIQQRLVAAGYPVSLGTPRTEAGRAVVDLTVGRP